MIIYMKKDDKMQKWKNTKKENQNFMAVAMMMMMVMKDDEM